MKYIVSILAIGLVIRGDVFKLKKIFHLLLVKKRIDHLKHKRVI